MTLHSGARLGPYEILGPLGAGGMGEVYRARDTRLDRTVAVKVLPETLAGNAQLRLRFEREAKAISALAHPNICTLHDVGTHDGIDFLVMEHLEGETLAERIGRGPLPVSEALKIGMEICDALDRAHRGGIIHRDLKPGNVMLTKSGAKLLDFGLARSVETEAVGANSMTLRAPATAAQPLTAEGTIVGTFQYMAPEQLEGLPVDARTDIFAFGALLYEMLTGRRAFDGKSRASVIAAILAAEPQSVSTLRPLTPAALDRVVSIAMRKDPDARWQSAWDLRLELDGLLAVADKAPPPSRRSAAGWIAAAAIALLAGAAALWDRNSNHVPPQPLRFEIFPSADRRFNTTDAPGTISPDGTKIVFSQIGVSSGNLWLRWLDSTELRELKGTSAAYDPFWSPDGRHIAFFSSGKLRKVDVVTGAVTTISNLVGDSRAGSWSPDGTILYSPAAFAPLSRVPASGGTPLQATTLDEANKETGHWRPSFLPDGKRFLFIAMSASPEQSGVYLGSLDSKERKKVLAIPAPAIYAAPDRLLFYNEGNVYAQPFDVDSGETSGEPSVVARNVSYTAQFASAGFSVSRNGTLVHNVQGDVAEARLARVEIATGAETPIEGVGSNLDRSRDGTRIAFMRSENQNRSNDIWVFDLRRGVDSRLTFDPSDEIGPVWSPDDRRIVYAVATPRGQLLRARDMSGREEELLPPQEYGIEAIDWSPDGKTILAEAGTKESRLDLVTLDLTTRKLSNYVSQPFVEQSGRFSPDGRWVAYMSDESGVPEIYVQPMPADGSKWQVSKGGGGTPRWSGDGRTLFYVGADRKLVSVPVLVTEGRFESGTPTTHFSVDSDDLILSRDATYAIVSRRESPVPLPMVVSMNWR